MLESRHRSSPRASASVEATNCDHTLFLSANQGFFYSLNVLLQASVALHASSWKQLLGTDVDGVATMTWAMSLPKHSGSE
jgi:hypothetical protein